MDVKVVRENHDTPRDVQARLTRAGGRTVLGDHPVYRLIWGGRRLDKFGFQLYAYAPRLLERWIVEKWVDGDYRYVTALEGRHHEFTPLNLKAIDLVVDLVEKSRDISDFTIREFWRDREAARDREFRDYATDMVRDRTLPMFGQPSAYFGGIKRKTA